jgi:hypothetical protein
MPKLPSDNADLVTVIREFKDAMRLIWFQLRQIRTEIQTLSEGVNKNTAEINNLKQS